MCPRSRKIECRLAASAKVMSASTVARHCTPEHAHARTSGSLIPGAVILTHTTSCPAVASAVTALPGKFSLPRKRILGCAGEDLFGTQCVARIRQTGYYVVVSYSG